MTLLTGYEIDGDTRCPNCSHPFSEHDPDLGCEHGWSWPTTREGCECPLTLAKQWH